MPAKSKSSKGPTQRQLRVGEAVRHAISDILGRRDLHDDVLQRTILTVPEVRMSSDLRIATVYIMPLGGGDEDRIIKALATHHKHLRSEIARMVDLKYAPDLRFMKDKSFDEGMRVDQILSSDRVRRDVESE